MIYSKYLNDNFLAFAHRGGNDFGPENSLKSFLGAYEIGYKYLETDVHLSKDGHLVAFHDECLDRVTNKTGLIKDLKLSDIKRAKIDNSEEIPTLIELLDNIPNCFFNIDCKSDDTVIPLIEVIKKFSLFDRVCIGSFSQKRINFIRESLGSKVKTSMGPSEILLVKVLSNLPIRKSFESTYASLPIRRYGIELLNKKNINFLQRNNQKVIAWTINDESEMRLLIERGVDGIMTDKILLLKKILIEQNKWK
tara:strand:- start:226 stop:978 length:753 start_codon:yes stop_codon:yes gene_type:complete